MPKFSIFKKIIQILKKCTDGKQYQRKGTLCGSEFMDMFLLAE